MDKINYFTIKDEKEKRISGIMEDLGLFFAFNEKQLIEGMKKTGIKEKSELVAIGCGGYMPKGNVDKYEDKWNEIYNWEIEEVKKLDPIPIIRYELANYESWYTGDISDAWEVLKKYGYTTEQVVKVFNDDADKHYND